MITSLSLTFSPFIPQWFVILLGSLALSVLIFAWWQRARGIGWRAGIFMGLVIALLNPSFSRERHQLLPDVVTVVVDESLSQHLGDRAHRAQQALDRLTEIISALPSVELSIVDSDNSAYQTNFETHLFTSTRTAVIDVPRSQRAATIVITDGQVHDIPTTTNDRALFAPVHVLLTGEHEEFDRRLVIDHVPQFGIVRKTVTVTLRIEETNDLAHTAGQILLHSISTGEHQSFTVSPGRELQLQLPIEHAGQNIFELILEPVDNELTELNNRVALSINGVRDRLRVLLISGAPHAGERVWRNILKADPSVDLVHFTILRAQDDIDYTPTQELSLIAFPVQELFEVKLNEFDLIILDQYQRRGLIPTLYFTKIVEYIRNGGALLEATGLTSTTFAHTPLGQILPSEPIARFEGPFYPRITDLGHYHPVTASLLETSQTEADASPPWGPWFRHLSVQVHRGMVIMSGAQERPLLILDRVGNGRIAQLTSDQIWLWARNYQQGGPHAELLRRLIHWLMKEPQLEENRLSAAPHNDATLRIERHRLTPDTRPVTVTAPDGTTTTVTLTDLGKGRSMTHVPAPLPGLYHISDGEHSTVTAVGTFDMLEYADMVTTEAKVTDIVTQTGGGIYWLTDFVDQGTFPEVRHRVSGRLLAGTSWFGIRANRAYVVEGVTTFSLLPLMVILGSIIALLITAWYREGS